MRVKKPFLWSALLFWTLLIVAIVWLSPSRLNENTIPSTENRASPREGAFPYGDYAAGLAAFVEEDRGMVNYKGMKEDRERLDAFVTAIDALDRTTYEPWSMEEKIAFWINTYNVLTLRAILDHYPIQSRWIASLIYPKNSVRQIKGVWDDIQFLVMGEERTLDKIEHEILRKAFNEPRIHVALVCAAMSCPPLRNEPYVADRLDTQLDDQTRRFLGFPENFRIDRERGRVYLSSIFKWYGEDFIEAYGTNEKYSGHSESERAVLQFISGYLDEESRNYLLSEDYSIKYLKYDWSLNEQNGT